jgi:hypothetical protein
MKCMSFVGLCLAGGVAMCAIVVTSAFATDTFEAGRCKKVTAGTGVYGDAGCTTPGGEQKFEWTPGYGAKKAFTSGKKGGEEPPEAELDSVGSGRIHCKNEVGTGEFDPSAPGEAGVKNVIDEFTGCAFGVDICTSPGQPSGQINTFKLKGTTGFVKTSAESAAKDQMGVDLVPESGEFIAEFGCLGGALKFDVRGSVIVEVKNEKMLTKATLTFAEKSGKQKPEKFEGLPKDVLEENINGGSFEQAGLLLTTIQTNEEQLELRVCRKGAPAKCEVT